MEPLLRPWDHYDDFKVRPAELGLPHFLVHGERISTSMRRQLTVDLCRFLNGADPVAWLLQLERLGDLRVRTRLGNTVAACGPLYVNPEVRGVESFQEKGCDHRLRKGLLDHLLTEVSKRTPTHR